MPTSVPGSSAHAIGFTLVEVLVAMLVLALASGLAVMALGDRSGARMDAEAERLAALLDVARSQARSAGAPITWEAVEGGYRFSPPLPGIGRDQRWQVAGTRVSVARVELGTEPVMAAQRIELLAGAQVRVVSSDGLGTFEVSRP